MLRVEAGLPEPTALRFLVEKSGDLWRLRAMLSHSYLEREEIDGLPVPPIPEDAFLVVEGKLPLWLWTALARAYAGVRILAVFEPRTSEAMVIASRDPDCPVGTRWPVEPAGAEQI